MNLRVLCFISSKIVQVNCRPGKVVPDNVFHAELNLRRKKKQKKRIVKNVQKTKNVKFDRYEGIDFSMAIIF